jgi:uncharacterized membrane protein
MAEKIRILLVGESWVSISTHIKGWDFFNSAIYEEGHEYLKKALSGEDFDFRHMPGHRASADFPLDEQGLRAYDVIILSDIGANTLLLHPDAWLHGKTVPNRLVLIKNWVRNGGALVMCGGYLSFAGIYGSAKFYHTPIEEVLPVTMYARDDRVEVPQGGKITSLHPDHPILSGIDHNYPPLLGYNEAKAKPEAEVLAEIDGNPFIAVMESGKGKTMVWTSDIGPHWCPRQFLDWSGYEHIWQQAIRWLARK